MRTVSAKPRCRFLLGTCPRAGEINHHDFAKTDFRLRGRSAQRWSRRDLPSPSRAAAPTGPRRGLCGTWSPSQPVSTARGAVRRGGRGPAGAVGAQGSSLVAAAWGPANPPPETALRSWLSSPSAPGRPPPAALRPDRCPGPLVRGGFAFRLPFTVYGVLFTSPPANGTAHCYSPTTLEIQPATKTENQRKCLGVYSPSAVPPAPKTMQSEKCSGEEGWRGTPLEEKWSARSQEAV